MLRRVVVGAISMGSIPAHADVYLSDPTIEVGVMYNAAPTRLGSERKAMIGTAVHVTDRNGVFSQYIADVFAGIGAGNTECGKKDDSGNYCVSEEMYTNGSRRYIRTNYSPIMPKQPQVRLEGVRTDVAIYQPRERSSNARGWSAGILSARHPRDATRRGTLVA